MTNAKNIAIVVVFIALLPAILVKKAIVAIKIASKKDPDKFWGIIVCLLIIAVIAIIVFLAGHLNYVSAKIDANYMI